MSLINAIDIFIATAKRKDPSSAKVTIAFLPERKNPHLAADCGSESESLSNQRNDTELPDEDLIDLTSSDQDEVVEIVTPKVDRSSADRVTDAARSLLRTIERKVESQPDILLAPKSRRVDRGEIDKINKRRPVVLLHRLALTTPSSKKNRPGTDDDEAERGQADTEALVPVEEGTKAKNESSVVEKIKTRRKIFYCLRCPFTVAVNRERMLLHLRRKHLGGGGGSFGVVSISEAQPCTKCEEIFFTNKDWIDHFILMHLMVAAVEEKVGCRHCEGTESPYATTHPYLLDAHTKAQHMARYTFESASNMFVPLARK